MPASRPGRLRYWERRAAVAGCCGPSGEAGCQPCRLPLRPVASHADCRCGQSAIPRLATGRRCRCPLWPPPGATVRHRPPPLGGTARCRSAPAPAPPPPAAAVARHRHRPPVASSRSPEPIGGAGNPCRSSAPTGRYAAITGTLPRPGDERPIVTGSGRRCTASGRTPRSPGPKSFVTATAHRRQHRSVLGIRTTNGPFTVAVRRRSVPSGSVGP